MYDGFWRRLGNKQKGSYFCCMSNVQIQVNCPYCQGSKVVKNGKKKTGQQNFLCRQCGKQFQYAYAKKGSNPAIKQLIVRMLIRNVGIRDSAWILGVSLGCVLACLKSFSFILQWKPRLKAYKTVQIDEFWTYVGRKKNKLWLIYAYSPDSDEILAIQWGKRDIKTVRKLYEQLKNLDIDRFYTDDWNAFAAVLPKEKHTIGKEFTKHIEGINTCLRARNRRCVRRTTCFSKKKENHIRLMNQIILNRNYHHTL